MMKIEGVGRRATAAITLCRTDRRALAGARSFGLSYTTNHPTTCKWRQRLLSYTWWAQLAPSEKYGDVLLRMYAVYNYTM